MHVQSFALGPIDTNCYIINKNDECLIIDPSGEAPVIKNYINEQKLTPQAILLTHAHFDHIGAVDEIRKEYAIDVYIHENEAEWLVNPKLNRSYYALGGEGISTSRPDKLVEEGTYTIGSFTFETIHTPGHSPGSMTYIFKDESFIVSGDVLFHQGIGRTDLPGGSIEQLIDSITNGLYSLPDDFTVYPGHGVPTTIAQEKATNPFTLQFFREV